MDTELAHRMTELTAAFYQRVGASFYATRQRPWEGWEPLLGLCGVRGAAHLDVLDLACGNLRFERYVAEHVGRLHAWCVDAQPLPEDAGDASFELSYQRLDLTQTNTVPHVPACDLSVSFGFLHHLPLARQREDLLRQLVAHTAAHGFVAVAFWQFAHDPRIAAKARPVPGGQANDYLLGWQGRTDVVRYCHHFDEAEIDSLLCGLDGVEEVARYSADGRGHNLNRYVVLRKTTIP